MGTPRRWESLGIIILLRFRLVLLCVFHRWVRLPYNYSPPLSAGFSNVEINRINFVYMHCTYIT